MGLALVLAAGCAPGDEQPAPGGMREFEASLEGLEQLAREFPPVDGAPLRWPQDHAAHPGQFTESWLVAGLLRDQSGGRHGFQLLLQRVALWSAEAERASAWAAEAAWYGRFVLEQPGAPQLAADRLSRDALGLAGTTEAPVAAWLEDWRIELQPESGTLTVRAQSDTGGMELRLALPPAPPAPLAAEARRGYWWPGLEGTGAIRHGETVLEVRGTALLERWWGRAPPAGSGQLALARVWLLDATGGAVRCEQLRRRGGGGTPLGSCTEYPSGREITAVPAPAGDEGVAGAPPLRWRLDWPGGGGDFAWEPLARPGDPGPEWSGLLVPEAAGVAAGRWGLLALSNFGAP
ncbi:lipocalin-like domain-containing protein [Thioalkalivibrio sp. XN8]|uniref:lipocalin-like domain-containing protein n=1 Tax=Thioalkalivibrio sp. XN8 TaxID=2712863 RepID=UPI0013EDDADA|nr:lipocalin-like domain-containing protein [Thioalkalivibrio sp. XN8]NGP54392.1 hypothetical protein [Thioalkalivibrio sp. XN8]